MTQPATICCTASCRSTKVQPRNRSTHTTHVRLTHSRSNVRFRGCPGADRTVRSCVLFHSRPERHSGHLVADSLAGVWSALVTYSAPRWVCLVGNSGSMINCIIYCLMSRLFSGLISCRPSRRALPHRFRINWSLSPSVRHWQFLLRLMSFASMSLFRGCIRALATPGSRLLLFAQVFVSPLFLSCSCAPVCCHRGAALLLILRL